MVPAEMTMTEEHKPDDEPTAPDLNEVLRLQAVALARMSERMNMHQSGAARPLPPVQDRTGSCLPMLASDVALSEDSMPVLSAFREFLDQERRRTRARILWISLLFVVLFSASAAVLVWMGREHIQELRADIGTANRKVEASRERADAEIRKISERANQSATVLKRDLNSSMTQAQSVLASNLNTKLQRSDAEMDLLKDKLSALEIENAVLVGRLREALERAEALQLEEMHAETEAEMDALAVEDQAKAGTVATEEEIPAVVEMMPASDSDRDPIVIQSPSYNRAFRLKVPVMTP
jgi:hypothetical protein